MEIIVREINLAYESVNRGKEEHFDSDMFAEDHIHSVSDLVSNKIVTEALCKLVISYKK